MIVRTWAGSYVEGKGRYGRIALGWIRFLLRTFWERLTLFCSEVLKHQ